VKSPCKNLGIFTDSRKTELINLSVQDRFGFVKERLSPLLGVTCSFKLRPFLTITNAFIFLKAVDDGHFCPKSSYCLHGWGTRTDGNLRCISQQHKQFSLFRQQTFERANETSTTANCPTRQQLAAEPRKQYSALLQLAYAIARTLKEPILQKQLAGTLTFIGKPSSRAIALKKAS